MIVTHFQKFNYKFDQKYQYLQLKLFAEKIYSGQWDWFDFFNIFFSDSIIKNATQVSKKERLTLLFKKIYQSKNWPKTKQKSEEIISTIQIQMIDDISSSKQDKNKQNFNFG